MVGVSAPQGQEACGRAGRATREAVAAAAAVRVGAQGERAQPREDMTSRAEGESWKAGSMRRAAGRCLLALSN